MDSNTTLLVMGTSRGGTTLLTASLGAHPDVAMLDEEFTGAVFRVTGGKIRGNKLCVPNHLEWRKHWHWSLRLAGLNGFLRKRKLYNLIPRSELSLQHYVTRAPLQPVCVLRDPSAVVHSIKTREHRRTGIAVYRWCRYMEIVEQLQETAQHHPNLKRPVIVSFEGLVAEPEAVLKALCGQLALPFSPLMLEGPQRNVRYPRQGFEPDKGQQRDKPSYLADIPAHALSRYQRLLEADIARQTSRHTVATTALA